MKFNRLKASIANNASEEPSVYMAVCAIESLLRDLEDEAGRRRGKVRNLPRTLDIDLIAFGNVTRTDPVLTLPHPRAKERLFVLQPLAELLPGYRFPDDPSVTVTDLLARF